MVAEVDRVRAIEGAERSLESMASVESRSPVQQGESGRERRRASCRLVASPRPPRPPRPAPTTPITTHSTQVSHAWCCLSLQQPPHPPTRPRPPPSSTATATTVLLLLTRRHQLAPRPPRTRPSRRALELTPAQPTAPTSSPPRPATPHSPRPPPRHLSPKMMKVRPSLPLRLLARADPVFPPRRSGACASLKTQPPSPSQRLRPPSSASRRVRPRPPLPLPAPRFLLGGVECRVLGALSGTRRATAELVWLLGASPMHRLIVDSDVQLSSGSVECSARAIEGVAAFGPHETEC